MELGVPIIFNFWDFKS